MRRMILGLFFTVALLSGLPSTVALAVADNQEAICDQPWVVYCENFDARALGQGDLARATYKNAGFTWSNISPPSGLTTITTQTDPQGVNSHVLELQCNGDYGLEKPGANICAGYIFAVFTQGIPQGTDVWIRFYTKWSSNFKHSWGEKHLGPSFTSDNGGINPFNEFNRATNYGYPWIFYFNIGMAPVPYPSPNPCIQTFPSPNEYYLFPCVGGQPNHTNSVNDQWYCLETHLRMNPDTDAFPSTGIAGMYVNGVQQFEYTNLNLVAHSIGQFVTSNSNRSIWEMSLYGRWYCAGTDQVDGPDGTSCVCLNGPGTCDLSASTHPWQYRWHDNLVVGTQRIGCLGSTPPPSDTISPVAPTNLRVSSLWDQFLKVFWTLASLVG